ncbi:MAG: hypothetical protein HETSPECPRED_010490 [Heterodermia speciosa]|uniref:Uncharacterized protein n=1 Tax=Heterodermia speciosa TaxID=116794 RepID=A0A8H3IWS3_9LECA|nr:MAG: hypothetical protein HETSPECPRED_010490 [Heterodermia speciosa]
MPTFRFTNLFLSKPGDRSREKYRRVRFEDDDEIDSIMHSDSQAQLASASHWKRTIALSIAIVCSSLVAILLTITVHSTTSLRDPVTEVVASPCGNSPTEARARGCHFDVISFCWLPDTCYDAELSETFDNMTTWEWFLDPNRTQPISHQQAMTGEYTGLYVNWEYHLRHCTAMWEKLHRAILGAGKSAIDGYIGPLDHTKHCSQMLLSDRDVALETINTIILVKYPSCGIA